MITCSKWAWFWIYNILISALISLQTCSIGFKWGDLVGKNIRSIFNILQILDMNLDLCGLKLSKINLIGFQILILF
jgi:hypothetical protein